MMLTLFHGDNQVLSRNALQSLVASAKRQGIKDILRLNGKKISLTELIEACETQSLFGTARLIVVEELHSHPSKKTLAELVSYLSQVSSSISISLWESKSLTAAQLKKFPKADVKLFKTSPVTFKFLDALAPGQAPVYVPLFQGACAQDTPEFVFFMLLRHLRLLLSAADPGTKLPPWQIGKLKAQYRRFGDDVLVGLHDKLWALDWRLKTGQTAQDLMGELSLILATL